MTYTAITIEKGQFIDVFVTTNEAMEFLDIPFDGTESFEAKIEQLRSVCSVQGYTLIIHI